MGKVRDEEKLCNEVVSRKRKKRKKELDLLRRNVLEAKRKLDNKTQGFDSKGGRAGLKKMCNRLLPSRKPQVGIFANGSKGDEIKRANLSLNESDRARFEGDLQKVLNDGKRRCTESRSDALNGILHIPLPGTMDTEEQEYIRIPDDKLERKPGQNLVAERQCGKRKLEAPIQLDGKIAKKSHSEAEKTKVVFQPARQGVPEISIAADKKWKRSLFADEECDHVSISEHANVGELRFSPTIGKSKAAAKPSEPKVSLDPPQGRSGINKMNFKYEQLGRMAPARYEQLCGKVCVENFETCLREIPHVDPLTKVRQSLLDVYVDTCNLKSAGDRTRLKVVFPEEYSTSDSRPVHSNIQKSKYFRDVVNVSPPRGVGTDPINPKNFSRWKVKETLSAESKSLMTKAEAKLEKNIPFVNRGHFSSGTSITEPNASSLNVNYDSSRWSLGSNIKEFLLVDNKLGNPDQKFSGIPSTRKNITWRYPDEENHPEHGSNVSAENDNVQICYLPDPSNRREIRNKKNRPVPEKKLDEIRQSTSASSKGGIAESTANSADVNSDNVKPCLGLGLGGLPKINRKGRTTVVNLGSASSSKLNQIPTDRGEIMQRYLKDLDNPEPRKADRTKIPLESFLDVAEDDKPKKRYLGDPLRRHRIKNTTFDRPNKNERHVPSILRKSHASKRNKTSNIAGTVSARGINSDLNFDKMYSESDGTLLNNLFGKKETPKKTATANRQASLEPLASVGLNALYDPGDEGVEDNRNFVDLGFTPEVTTDRRNIANPSRGLNFSGAFDQSTTYRQQYSSDNAGLTNFHNARQPLNLPMFHRQQRDRKNASTVQNETRRERHQDNSFAEINEPKVIILKNPSVRGAGEEFGRGTNVPDLPYKNDGQNLQQNRTGFRFAAIPRGMTMAPMRTVQLQNCRQFHAPNVSRHGEQLQVRRCTCKNDLRNVHQVPMNVYQNEIQNSVYSLRDANAEIKRNSDTAESVRFFDGRVGFVLPKNDSGPFCQTAINIPINSEQMLHRQKYGPVLSEDINCSSEYFIDPRYPQAGYKWNQIDQSGTQPHHVIQPVYNVTDAYRPQVPHNYYPNDSQISSHP